MVEDVAYARNLRVGQFFSFSVFPSDTAFADRRPGSVLLSIRISQFRRENNKLQPPNSSHQTIHIFTADIDSDKSNLQ